MNVLGIQLRSPTNLALLGVAIENMIVISVMFFLLSKNIINIVDLGSFVSAFMVSSVLLVSGLSLKDNALKSIAILLFVSLGLWYLSNFLFA